MKPISLFLMAHQDDEYGVFHQIKYELSAGRCVRCVYVTDGAATADTERRNRESIGVLKKLGVAPNDILFVGRQLSIGDGRLHENVGVFATWLHRYLDEQSPLHTCFVPAWEGGHPDHDLLHAIAVKLLETRENSTTIRQYPLYNGRQCFGPFFRAMSPLPENGPIQQQLIPLRDRLLYIRLCLSYPSQWRTWLGLFPFVGWHYLFYGVQYLQDVNCQRLEQPPHAGLLYYERRGFLDYPRMRSAIEQLLHYKTAN